MTASNPSNELRLLLQGQSGVIAPWTERLEARRLACQVAIIILGAGTYGAAMGWWRDPQQALYVAIKFPLIILLTVIGNALINGMLAPLLGLNVPFRQSFSAIVMSFVVVSAILGAFSPVFAFMVWNAPGLGSGSGATYDLILLANVAVIALAGITGNVRLFQLLVRLGGSRAVAFRALCAWLIGNLFLGSQLSWNLRPFIGSPGLPVQFLRPDAFHGNFYEAVFHSLTKILND
ncbi:MAG TPA: hypothetical protein VN625_08265 [Desulfuromonadaceae bacterium]|nr:hypothetical protein [Desulfuromonadaceae bacterium]